MNEKEFFDTIRANLFEGMLTTPQVVGINNILIAYDALAVNRNADHLAFILANVYHETGTWMAPIKETVMKYHTDKNPSDKTVISRLDRAFAAGQLPWVKTPYWRSGYFGRGQIQITHLSNYKKMGDVLGVDLAGNPDLALDPAVSSRIAVYGMLSGSFTGKNLNDYKFPGAVDAEAKNNPRRIINGVDGTDKDVARYYKVFRQALINAGYGKEVEGEVVTPEPAPAPAKPKRTRSIILAEIEVLLAELKSMGD
jgi:predicted chitinase